MTTLQHSRHQNANGSDHEQELGYPSSPLTLPKDSFCVVWVHHPPLNDTQTLASFQEKSAKDPITTLKDIMMMA